MNEDLPAPGLFAGVVSQEAAVAALRAAAANPVHAYLFRGAPGNGGLAAAYGFAAALLCPDGGCGVCATCRAALAGTDPDLHVVRRSGASVSIGDLRQVVSLAQRRPLHAARQVIVVLDVHLAALPGPGPPQDTGGATGRHGVHPAGRRRHSRVGHGGQPLRRGRLPAGAAGRAGAVADRIGRPGRHGGRGGGQRRRQPRTGADHGRRSRRGRPRGAVDLGARRADVGGHDGGRV